MKTKFLIAALLALALPAGAGDLTVKAQAGGFSVSNNLAQGVYVMAVMGGNQYLPVNLELAPGASKPVKFAGTLPTSLSARALGMAGQAIAGRTVAPEGFYTLSVDFSN